MNNKYLKVFFTTTLVLMGILYFNRLRRSSTVNIPTPANTPTSSPSAAETQNYKPNRDAASEKKMSLEDYINSQSVKRWTVNKNDQGEIISLTHGELIKKVATDSEARSTAMELAPYLNVNSKHIGELLPVAEPTLTKAYTFKQVVDGYDVYQSSLTVITRTEDDAVILINNSLKTIATAPVNPGFSASQAWRVIETDSKFNVRNPQKEGSEKLVIYGSQLAWMFTVKLQTPYDQQEVLVGTQTHDILSAFTLLRR